MLNKIIGIYCITSPSNKKYIGQSWDIEKRKTRYKSAEKSNSCNSQIKLYNSIKKYGWLNHSFEILKEFTNNITQKELDENEIKTIEKYKNDGFELMNIRNGGSRGKLSDETKEKIRIKASGRKHSEESLTKIRIARLRQQINNNPRIGCKHSSESKLKMSNKLKGKKGNRLGVVVSDEVRQRMKDAQKLWRIKIQQNE